MKKILFTLLLLSLPVMIKATGQMAESLLINGEYWQLYYCPIETDMALSEEIAKAIELLPETITEDSIEWVKDQSTALWRNYIAEWEIKDNRLFLREIGVPYIREVGNRLEEHFFTLNEEKLKEIFAPYYTTEGICASWFCDTMRAGRGKEIYYEHMAFARHNENECLIVVDNGVVREIAQHNNYHKEGIAPSDVCKALAENFPWEKFPEYEETRFVLQFSDYIIDENGILQDCNVQCLRPDEYESMSQDSPLIMAVKAVLKDLKPWPVWYINGKFETRYLNRTYPLKKGTKAPDDKLGNLKNGHTKKPYIITAL